MSKENNGKPQDEEPIDGLDFTELKKYMATQMMCPFNNKKCNAVYKIITDAMKKKKEEYFNSLSPSKCSSKGRWNYSNSSGYDGWRCEICATWVCEGNPLKCDCDK